MSKIDIYEECVGQIGRWQLFMIILLSLIRISVPWHQLNIVFLAPMSKFECSDLELDKCSSSCPSHVFEEDWETIVSKWDLVCENQYLVTLTQSISMVGMIVGSVLIGFLSDIYGRKNPLLISNAMVTLAGLATAFAPWFWLFMTLKFLSNVALGGITLNAFVLSMELIGKSYRTSVGSLFHIPYFFGYGFLGLLGYLIRDWRYLQGSISIFSLIFLTYFWIIPESPRWLLTRDRNEEAIEIMYKAAMTNRKPTYSIKEKVTNYLQSKSKEDSVPAGYFRDLIRTRNMRIRSLSMFIIYFFIFFVYFGVSQYLGEIGNSYVNIGISGLIQIPGSFICMYLMNKIGRKRTFIVANVFNSLACFLILVVPEDMDWGYTLLGGLGILFNCVATSVLYIYSGELFPTIVRSLGMGACSTLAKVGSAIAPFLIGLKMKLPWLPPIVLGLFPLFASVFCLILPETLNQKLPDTIEEIEDDSRHQIDENVIHVMQ